MAANLEVPEVVEEAERLRKVEVMVSRVFALR